MQVMPTKSGTAHFEQQPFLDSLRMQHMMQSLSSNLCDALPALNDQSSWQKHLHFDYQTSRDLRGLG
jgi:hypothetical protein